jgi:phosphohistidine phosphatase SixA
VFVLARHGHAGDDPRWPFDSADRPLSELGEEQAAGLAATLSGFAVTRLVAGPYLRCRQTLSPLADATGLPIEVEPLLSPRGDAAMLDRLVRQPLGDGVVWCTHGQTIARLLRRWRRQGSVELGSVELRVDPAARLRKSTTARGAAWVVHEQQVPERLRAEYLRPVHVLSAAAQELAG